LAITAHLGNSSEQVIDPSDAGGAGSSAHDQLDSLEAASLLDAQDCVPSLQEQFHVPRVSHLGLAPKDGHEDGQEGESEDKCIYMCGHSLGLQPCRAAPLVQAELAKWAAKGHLGHFTGAAPWASCDLVVLDDMAALVGAHPAEVAICNSLTVNLHLLLLMFYRPSGARARILMEVGAFSSDRFAVQSQLRLHGHDPSVDLVLVAPRPGENALREEDIEARIAAEGAALALVLLPGVLFNTGQLLDVARLTAAAHAAGAVAGWDMAHAVGNVPLRLTAWNVDFAVWCSYKYLNAGAGGVGGLFVAAAHSRARAALPAPAPGHLLGWWGGRSETRFAMDAEADLAPGAAALRLSNPAMLATALLRASLQTFLLAGLDMGALRAKSRRLTAYLERLLRTRCPEVGLVTPAAPTQRGAMLVLRLPTHLPGTLVNQALGTRGLLCDHRPPNLLRLTPAPLYNSYRDVFRAVCILQEVLGLAEKNCLPEKAPVHEDAPALTEPSLPEGLLAH